MLIALRIDGNQGVVAVIAAKKKDADQGLVVGGLSNMQLTQTREKCGGSQRVTGAEDELSAIHGTYL